MKRVLTACVLATAIVSAGAADTTWVDSPFTIASTSGQQPADIEGSWAGRVWISEKTPAAREPRLQLNLTLDEERNWGNWGQSVPLTAFTNLPANLDAPQDVTFELRREAGVLRFRGRFESGRGIGHFSFHANREFERVMQQETGELITDRELFSLALLDVSRAFVQELRALGFKDVTLEDARKARIHGVSRQYIESMRAAGLRDASLDEFVKFKIHGVSAAYAADMRDAGLAMNIDDVLQMKIHGITPAYAKEMRAIAGTHADAGDVKRMKIHGVTPAFAKEMAALGYKNLDADALVKFRIHGITPAFVKELADLGYKNLSEDELVEWAIHGRRFLKMRRR